MRHLIYPIKVLILLMPFGIVSCSKEHSLLITPITYGNTVCSFTQNVNGEKLRLDTLIYSTSSGNVYMINELQYFVSHFRLHSVSANWVEIRAGGGIHYTDARDTKSCSWWPNDALKTGKYDSVAFTFGLNDQDNISGRFPDPPQRDMFWPGMMGGGYHYMKLDLKWIKPGMQHSQVFNFHLGIGQIYEGNSLNPDSIISFVPNYFMVALPCNFEITKGAVSQLIIEMDISRWFDGNNRFDFAAYPGGIMQNQVAMNKACLNGRGAFSILHGMK